LLGTTTRDLITHLDLWIGDESLAGAAAFLVGGVGRWDALRLSAMSASEIGPAWRHVLDVTRRRTSFGDEPVPPDAYLAVLLHAHEAMQGPGGPVTASLLAEQLGWMGSAREICIRLAGELYRYGMARGTGMREGAFLDAYRAALECWDIVEELDDGLTPHQIRIWRGMRGSSG
jgi:hypothetical protein